MNSNAIKLLAFSAILAWGPLHAADPALAQEESPAPEAITDAQLEDFLTQATDIFNKNQANPKKRIPDALLADADAIMIFRIRSGGIVIGASSGAGVAFKNNIDNWSPPVFYKVATGSLGIQIGAQETDIIALLMNADATDILDDPAIQWGVGLNIVAGPTGGNVAANTIPKADILVYETTKGLDLGVSVRGGTVKPNQSFNDELYDQKGITAEWILGSQVPMPEAAKPLTDLLREYSFVATQGQK